MSRPVRPVVGLGSFEAPEMPDWVRQRQDRPYVRPDGPPMLAAMGLLAVMTILAAVGLTAMRSAASTVPPPDDVHWLQLADCESGGRAHLATGNGFYGALQWLPSTWAAARGPDDPLRAVDADLATEIAVAYDWAHRADPFGQWPACWPAALARPNSDVPAWATVSPGDGDPAPPATPTQQPVLLTG